ncbi:hypothetical protein LTR95_006428, partial [Oleoguttula sp. CCFEE 5521]
VASPTALKRRQSLLFITAPKNPEDSVEPALFNLVDLIRSSLTSSNAQTVYAALRLSTTILVRQPRYAFSTLLSVQPATSQDLTRTAGALQLEIGKYAQIAASLHDQALDDAFIDLVDDGRTAIEAQLPDPTSGTQFDEAASNRCTLPSGDNFMRLVSAQLNTFWTNSIDVNLAVTQALASVALCTTLCLNGYFCLDPAHYAYAEPQHAVIRRSWQKHLTNDEDDDLGALEKDHRTPIWPDDHAAHLPRLYSILLSLTAELDGTRQDVPNLDQLISGRKHMLQAADVDASMTGVPSSSVFAYQDANAGPTGNNVMSASRSDSPLRTPEPGDTSSDDSPSPGKLSLFQPPPPESPSTTDVLMQVLTFPSPSGNEAGPRTATLNHVLTNVVVLQEFVLEIAAIIQARAAVLGEREVSVGRART